MPWFWLLIWHGLIIRGHGCHDFGFWPVFKSSTLYSTKSMISGMTTLAASGILNVEVCSFFHLNLDAMEPLFGYLLVSLCWGLTNPFIKKAAERIKTIWDYLDWRYLVPLGINLSGSTVYYYTLGSVPLSTAVPVTNSLSFVMTCLGGRMLGEDMGTWKTWLGIVMILLGTAVCTW